MDGRDKPDHDNKIDSINAGSAASTAQRITTSTWAKSPARMVNSR